MKSDIRIIPIIVGAERPKTSGRLQLPLKPYLLPETCLSSAVISHITASYADAVMVDKKTADAITTNDPNKLLITLADNAKQNIRNLATSLCGIPLCSHCCI